MIATPVTESSQVAEARRQAVAAAKTSGFDELAAARAALVATELATNLVKHATEGELLTGPFEDSTGAGLEIISLDKGPGMADLQASLRDGYSTAGSQGAGLGAVGRQAEVVEVVSQVNVGTAVLARLGPGKTRAEPPVSRAAWGAVTVPLPGEEVCGDGYCVRSNAEGRTLLVVDGLGHGRAAAEAANEAVRLFRANEGDSPVAIIQALHAGMRATRGGAVAVARMEIAAGRLLYAGVGNIAGAIVSGSGKQNMVSHNGTVGLNARKIQVFEYALPPSAVVVMHSDGLAAGWSLDRYPGLMNAHPSLIAAVLYRDFGRRRDDVTVLVSRAEE